MASEVVLKKIHVFEEYKDQKKTKTGNLNVVESLQWGKELTSSGIHKATVQYITRQGSLKKFLSGMRINAV